MTVEDALVAKDPAVTVAYTNWSPFIAEADKEGTVCGNLEMFRKIYGRICGSLGPLHRGSCLSGGSHRPRKDCSVGLAVYLSGASYEKSCVPNAIPYLPGGKTMIIMATRDIANGEEVRAISLITVERI